MALECFEPGLLADNKPAWLSDFGLFELESNFGTYDPIGKAEAKLKLSICRRITRPLNTSFSSLNLQHARALYELICGSPVSEPVGLVITKDPHLDPNRFKHQITCQMGEYRGITHHNGEHSTFQRAHNLLP